MDGAAINMNFLSDAEKKALADGTLSMARIEELMGATKVREDQAHLPPETRATLAAMVADEEKRYAEKAAKLQLGTVKAPVPVDQLPPAQQAAVRGALNSMMASPAAAEMAAPAAPAPAPAQNTVLAARMQAVKEQASPAQAASAAPPQTGEENPVKAVICPFCGWDHADAVVALTDDDKRSWLRALLGRQGWVKEFSVLDGKVKGAFRTRSRYVDDLISRQLRLEMLDGRLPQPLTAVEVRTINVRIGELTIAASLARSPDSPETLPVIDSKDAAALYGVDAAKIAGVLPTYDAQGKLTKPGEDTILVAAVDTLIKPMHEPVFAIVEQQMRVFDSLCLRLKEGAHSPGFWKETVS